VSLNIFQSNLIIRAMLVLGSFLIYNFKEL